MSARGGEGDGGYRIDSVVAGSHGQRAQPVIVAAPVAALKWRCLSTISYYIPPVFFSPSGRASSIIAFLAWQHSMGKTKLVIC